MAKDLQAIVDKISGLQVAELFLFGYIILSSYNPNEQRFEVEGLQGILMGGGGLAALVGEKRRKPPDSLPQIATEPDFEYIESLAAPEAHERPQSPDADADDVAEHEPSLLSFLEPSELRYQAEALRNTFLKASTADSSTLPDTEKRPIAAGYRLPIEAWTRVDRQHFRITNQGQEFFIFEPDFELLGLDGKPLATAKPVISTPLMLPTGAVDLHSAIIPGGNFSWAEATRNGERVPQSAAIVTQIQRAAQAMQEIRLLLGDRPITITSWYRPPNVNRSVGGASQSRHLNGDGVDFAVPSIAAPEVFRRLDGWWGSRGGLASSRRYHFTHIDLRGVRARWDY